MIQIIGSFAAIAAAQALGGGQAALLEESGNWIMKSLVIAEKPSVGRDIARVLGCRQGGSGFLEGRTIS